MRFLIDECLHTSLVPLANAAGFEAYHVAHLGLCGASDRELMKRIREEDFTFVTNNVVDFRKLFAREQLHAGLVLIVPNLTPAMQRELFKFALEELRNHDPVNSVIEADLNGDILTIHVYDLSEPADDDDYSASRS